MIFKEIPDKRLNITGNSNHRYVEYKDGHIVFSYTQKGKAMAAHVAADKQGLRYIKQSINDFCDWLFYNYSYINMVLAVIEKKSIERVVKKCNFKYVDNVQGYNVYTRLR